MSSVSYIEIEPDEEPYKEVKLQNNVVEYDDLATSGEAKRVEERSADPVEEESAGEPDQSWVLAGSLQEERSVHGAQV